MKLNDLFRAYIKDMQRRGVKSIKRTQQFYDNDIRKVIGDRYQISFVVILHHYCLI